MSQLNFVLIDWSQVINDLHQFARDGDLLRLTECLDSGVQKEKVNELDAKENTPLHYACRLDQSIENLT